MRVLTLPTLAPKKAASALVFLYCLVQSLILLTFGINTSNEAEKYILEGTRLASGMGLSSAKYLFYSPMILLVACCQWLSLPLQWTVSVNLLLNALATGCFYRLLKNIGGQTRAFWGTALLIVFFPLQIWNWTLYSDSIFISLSTLYLCLASNYLRKDDPSPLLVGAFLPLLILARPNGLLFLPPAILTLWLIRDRSKNILRILSLSLLLILPTILLTNYLFRSGGDLDIMRPFLEEHIICFLPTTTQTPGLTLLLQGNPLEQLLYYISHNPAHFTKLLSERILSFFNLYRPYYSNLNNAILIGWMTLTYTLFLRGIRPFIRENKRLSQFIIPILLLYPVGIALQCDDWHSRFHFVITPYLLLIGTYTLPRSPKRDQLR